MNISVPRQKFEEAMDSIREGVSGTTLYIPGRHVTVPSEDVETLWEHASTDSEAIRKYIESFEDAIDESDEQQASLIEQLLENVRFEDKVIYEDDSCESEEFSAIVLQVHHLDEDQNEYYALNYIPWNKSRNKRDIYIPQCSGVLSATIHPDGYRRRDTGHVKLAQPIEELALYRGMTVNGIELMVKENIPTWVCTDDYSLWDIKLPPLYKLAIYISAGNFDKMLEKISSTFKDRCERLEIAHWNYELGDYEWFIDDPDINYLENAESDDVEDDIDADQQENTEEDLTETGATNIQPPIPAGKKSFADFLEIVDLPSGYIIKEHGVWVEKEDDNGKIKKIRISSTGILVVALARTENQPRWMTLVVWVDLDGEFQEALFPSESLTSSRECIAELQARGCRFPFGQDNEIKAYLAKFEPTIRYRLATKTGWYTGQDDSMHFALPNQIIGKNSGEEIYFRTNSNNSIRQMGTFEDWQEHVAQAASGNPILTLTLSMAFAPPLLKIVNGETGGFHLHGLTSRGKTTAAMVAASVMGNGAPPSSSSGDSYINTWRATSNALEGVAGARNDILLILDELGQAVTENLPQTIYDLSSGTGKERMTTGATLAEKHSWNLLLLSTGEVSAQEELEKHNTPAKGGQLVRFTNIDIEDDIILDSHGKSSADFVDDLRKNCATHYGWAGPIFIENLIATLEAPHGRKKLAEDYLECCTLLSPPGLDAEQYRVLKRFALVLLAGKYAAKYGIIPLAEEEISSSIEALCSRWLETSEPLSDSMRAIENIRDYLAANSTKFYDTNHMGNINSNNISGYRKVINGTLFYLFPKDTFDKAVKVSNHRALLRKLDQLGLLHKNNKDKYQARFVLSNNLSGKEGLKHSFYAISADILSYGLPPEPPSKVLPRRVFVKPRNF